MYEENSDVTRDDLNPTRDPDRHEIARAQEIAEKVGLPIKPYYHALALNRAAAAAGEAGIPTEALLSALGDDWIDVTGDGSRKPYEPYLARGLLETIAGYVADRLLDPEYDDPHDGVDPEDLLEDPSAEAFLSPPIWTYHDLAKTSQKELAELAADLASYYRMIHAPHLRAGRTPRIQKTHPYSLTVAPELGAASIAARLRCPIFWVRWLRKLGDASREYAAANLAAANPRDPNGIGALSGSTKISRVTLGILTMREKRSNEYLSSINLVDRKTGEIHGNLLEIRKSARKRRQAGMNAVIQGMQDYANETGRVWVFLTLTLPGEWHATTTTGNRSSTWNGKSFEECHHEIHDRWRNLSRAMQHKKIKWYGLRVTEAHQDGTPHWHAQLYVKPDELDALQSLIIKYFPDPETDPDARRRTRIVIEDKNRNDHASALSYITKYIRKSIHETCPDSMKLRAHRRRAYQFFGVANTLSFWQRMVSAPEYHRPNDNGLGDLLWDATHPAEGERRKFLVWMRLIRDKALRVKKIYEDTGEVGRYGDPVIRAIGARVTTVDDEWVCEFPEGRFFLAHANGTPVNPRDAQLWVVIQEGQNPDDLDDVDALEEVFGGISVTDWVPSGPDPGPPH